MFRLCTTMLDTHDPSSVTSDDLKGSSEATTTIPVDMSNDLRSLRKSCRVVVSSAGRRKWHDNKRPWAEGEREIHKNRVAFKARKCRPTQEYRVMGHWSTVACAVTLMTQMCEDP